MRSRERKEIDDWLAEQTRCALCWHDGNEWTRWLERHHLVGRGKHDCKANWLRLCHRCHSHFTAGGWGIPEITRGMLLTAKQESDPENYSLESLRKIRPWTVLEPQPIDEFYLLERSNNENHKKGWRPDTLPN